MKKESLIFTIVLFSIKSLYSFEIGISTGYRHFLFEDRFIIEHAIGDSVYLSQEKITEYQHNVGFKYGMYFDLFETVKSGLFISGYLPLNSVLDYSDVLPIDSLTYKARLPLNGKHYDAYEQKYEYSVFYLGALIRIYEPRRKRFFFEISPEIAMTSLYKRTSDKYLIVRTDLSKPKYYLREKNIVEEYFLNVNPSMNLTIGYEFICKKINNKIRIGADIKSLYGNFWTYRFYSRKNSYDAELKDNYYENGIRIGNLSIVAEYEIAIRGN